MKCSTCKWHPPVLGKRTCERCLAYASAYQKRNRERINKWKRQRWADRYSTGRPTGRPRKVNQ